MIDNEVRGKLFSFVNWRPMEQFHVRILQQTWRSEFMLPRREAVVLTIPAGLRWLKSKLYISGRENEGTITT